MTERTVECLTDRWWDTEERKFTGTLMQGTLIAVTTAGKDGEIFPVGIVLYQDNTIESVPVEFIKNINE